MRQRANEVLVSAPAETLLNAHCIYCVYRKYEKRGGKIVVNQTLDSAQTPAMFVFLTSFPPGRGFRHLKVGHVRQLRVGPAGGERAERERRRPALLPGGGEHLPELQDQPESGAAPLRRLPPRRVSGSAAQQAR